MEIENSDERKAYLQEVEEIVTHGDFQSQVEFLDAVFRLYDGKYGKTESYHELKEKFNSFMLQQEEAIMARIKSTQDPLRTAIQAAQAGNYIDCMALPEIDEAILGKLLANFEDNPLMEDIYDEFLEDLSRAKHLVYLTDNCGEIVMDKLLIRIIQERYPQVEIQVIVRGEEVLNDATMEDARQVRLDTVASVEGNGTALSGTCLHLIPEKIRKRIESADVIIAKGQGNYESLVGCRLNVYYTFLCKCQYLMGKFSCEHLHPIFYPESRIHNTDDELH